MEYCHYDEIETLNKILLHERELNAPLSGKSKRFIRPKVRPQANSVRVLRPVSFED